ncbi:hypothetical protein POM88_047080 [Heracleum sosnowskyi]|uniref:Uncharacterized protein n=1 Tax=Heracleum sosnowskyi TaxID=360622 RepID=A0AAD8H9U1_9APIA|nr:hypothetical protein POM88_047080 [Heracleum sosnowskyi]
MDLKQGMMDVYLELFDMSTCTFCYVHTVLYFSMLHGEVNDKVCLTYWLNVLQNISQKGLPYLVTLNPSVVPNHTLLKWTTGHPVPNVAATKASFELDCIQGKRGIWFCGAYQGYGFHEDGLKAGMVAENGVLRKNSTLLRNPKHMVLSTLESGARLFVTRFLKTYITTGCLILLEEGGTVFTFEGTAKKSSLKVYLRVHGPQFYWKIVTQANLGLAGAYINGDFSFVDKKEGLLNIFMLFIANGDLKTSVSRVKNQRGWWTPMFLTAGIASAKYYFHHVLRQNTLTQARRNISRHYDLSNEHFALFLDETMTYSCAKFKVRGLLWFFIAKRLEEVHMCNKLANHMYELDLLTQGPSKLVKTVSEFAEAGTVFDVQDLLMRCALQSVFKVGFRVDLNCLEGSGYWDFQDGDASSTRYQKKVQEWNQLMAKGNSITSCGSKRKAPPVEKPIMFAFCLKPRGLEVPNKGLKYRSQKKYRVSGHGVVRDQNRVHTRARRFNSFAVGDEKATNFDVSPENSDNFSMLQTSKSSPEQELRRTMKFLRLVVDGEV